VRTLVLGLGNELAGDDAVGPLVARALLVELDGVADVVEGQRRRSLSLKRCRQSVHCMFTRAPGPA